MLLSLKGLENKEKNSISSKDSSPSGTCSIASVYKGWELYWAQDLSPGVRVWLEMKHAETLGLQETLARQITLPKNMSRM